MIIKIEVTFFPNLGSKLLSSIWMIAADWWDLAGI